MLSSEQECRKLILHEHVNNPNIGNRELARRLKISQSTVSFVLKKFRERFTIERKQGSGGKQGVKYPEVEKKIVALFKKSPKMSTRDMAKKVGKSSSYVQKVKKRAGLKSFKAQATPDRNAQQNFYARSRSRKLYEELLTKHDCVVMDDETYCKADFTQIAGHDFYTARNRQEAPENCKLKKRSKFPKKFLIWQAICSCGLKSRAFITVGTINQEVYQTQCLQKRLLPFLRQHQTQPLFWPDLATAHYSKNVQEWYRKNNVIVVPKECNPPNCPELRPIEQYWSIIKGILKKKGRKVSTVQEFRSKWVWATQKVDDNLVQKLMSQVRRKVRNKAYADDHN